MLRLLLLAALVVAAPAAASAPVPPSAVAERVDVESVSFTRGVDGLVARVHTSSRVLAYSIDHSAGTPELTLYRAQLAPAVAQDRVQSPVRAYQLGSEADRVTVRFEVEPGVRMRAAPDPDSDDLLVSFIEGAAPMAAPIVATPIVEPRPAPTPRSEVRVAAEVAPAPPVVAPAPAPPVIEATGADHWELDTIVLDAGHGGGDHGGVGHGTSDKEVAFGVVQRLGPMLERELGVRVVYTRDDDTFVELRDRGRIANREGGKLFISVHANAGPSSAHGTETFFLAPRGSARASQVMQRENSVIELESDPSYYADFQDGGDIVRSLAMSAYQEESQHLATLIEREFVRSGRHSRGVKQDNFMVLWAASMPAVLVEVGFVTNREEARLISSPDGMDRTARAIFEAVRAYKTDYERGLHATGL